MKEYYTALIVAATVVIHAEAADLAGSFEVEVEVESVVGSSKQPVKIVANTEVMRCRGTRPARPFRFISKRISQLSPIYRGARIQGQPAILDSTLERMPPTNKGPIQTLNKVPKESADAETIRPPSPF